MPSYYARTALQIIDGAFRLCLDYRGSGADGRIWKRTEALDEFNFTLIDLAKNTGILRGTQLIQIVAGTNIYNLPTDCIRPTRFVMNGDLSGEFLLPTSMTRVDLLRMPMTPQGNPRRFYKEFLAPNQIGFMPVPSQSGATVTGTTDLTDTLGNVQVWYIRVPTVVTGTASYPDIGIPEFIHLWIKYGVAARMCMYSKTKIHQEKLKRFTLVWRMAVNRVKRLGMWQGPIQEVRPL